MAKRYLTNKLINREDIKEDIKLIEESKNDYITPSGKIYTDYGDNKFFPKKTFVNNHNGYLYVNLNGIEGKTIQRRVHRLVAIAFLPNPDNLPLVMHKDNNKQNPNIDNLQWGTTQENTQNAFDDGLIINEKGFNDSQSKPIIVLDLDRQIIAHYGSVSIAAEKTGITKTGILYQCNHKMKTKPKCKYYFRFLDEYKEKGFVL